MTGDMLRDTSNEEESANCHAPIVLFVFLVCNLTTETPKAIVKDPIPNAREDGREERQRGQSKRDRIREGPSALVAVWLGSISKTGRGWRSLVSCRRGRRGRRIGGEGLCLWQTCVEGLCDHVLGRSSSPDEKGRETPDDPCRECRVHGHNLQARVPKHRREALGGNSRTGAIPKDAFDGTTSTEAVWGGPTGDWVHRQSQSQSQSQEPSSTRRGRPKAQQNVWVFRLNVRQKNVGTEDRCCGV